MNVVALIGRLVADPELRYTPSGVAVTSLRIAVDRGIKSQSGEKESDFFDVVVWEKSAEYASNYLTKGQRVGVSGRLQQRTWVQQDGQKRSKIDIVAQRIEGLDRPQGAPGGAAPRDSGERPPMEQPVGMGEADMDYDPFAEE